MCISHRMEKHITVRQNVKRENYRFGVCPGQQSARSEVKMETFIIPAAVQEHLRRMCILQIMVRNIMGILHVPD